MGVIWGDLGSRGGVWGRLEVRLRFGVSSGDLGVSFLLILGYFCAPPQIECSSISDYAVKIVKANKLDHGEGLPHCAP